MIRNNVPPSRLPTWRELCIPLAADDDGVAVVVTHLNSATGGFRRADRRTVGVSVIESLDKRSARIAPGSTHDAYEAIGYCRSPRPREGTRVTRASASPGRSAPRSAPRCTAWRAPMKPLPVRSRGGRRTAVRASDCSILPSSSGRPTTTAPPSRQSTRRAPFTVVCEGRPLMHTTFAPTGRPSRRASTA